MKGTRRYLLFREARFSRWQKKRAREREHREIEDGNIDVVLDALIYFQKVQ